MVINYIEYQDDGDDDLLYFKLGFMHFCSSRILVDYDRDIIMDRMFIFLDDPATDFCFFIRG